MIKINRTTPCLNKNKKGGQNEKKEIALFKTFE